MTNPAIIQPIPIRVVTSGMSLARGSYDKAPTASPEKNIVADLIAFVAVQFLTPIRRSAAMKSSVIA